MRLPRLSRSAPADRGRTAAHAATVFACLVLLCWGLLLVLTSVDSGQRRDIDLTRVHSLEGVGRTGGELVVEASAQSPAGMVVPVARPLGSARLRVRFSELDRQVRSITVAPRPPGGEFGDLPATTVVVLAATDTFDLRISTDAYDALRLDVDVGAAQEESRIAELALLPVRPVDHWLVPWVGAIAIAGGLLVPGLLLASLVVPASPRRDRLLLPAFLLSILFLAAAYGVVHVLVRVASGHAPALTWLVVGGALAVIAVAALGRRRRWRLITGIYDARLALACYLVVVCACTWIVVDGTDLPLTNLHYKSISGPKTYAAFNAHDNYFQYVNARVLAENESFEEYYGTRKRPKLFFLPQDRGMLPGAIYAVYRKLLDALSPALADSYLYYTLFGIACNAMVVFPLLAFARRIAPAVPSWVVLLAVSLNAFVLVNYYLTWFKFAGAALFLSGLYALFRERDRLAAWGFAGLSFGVGANMHAGVALGIPLFFLWLTAWHAQETGWRRPRWMVGPALLVGAFVAANLPWSLIKQTWFTDEQVLLNMFFFGSIGHPDGLLATVRLFFHEVPIADQIALKLDRFQGALQIPEIGGMLARFVAGDFRAAMLDWNQIEYSRLIGALLPGAVFWILAERRQGIETGPPLRVEQPFSVRTRRSMVGLAILTFLLIDAAAYTSTPGGATASQPMGLELLALTVMSGITLQTPGTLRVVYGLFLAVAAWRLLWLL